MRRAVIISIAFHALVSIVVFEWVSFSQVDYVPRQVYDVTLVTQAAAEPARKVAAPEPEPPAPAPVEEEEKEDEMPPPPEVIKKKPPVKKPETRKTVPTTQIQKTATPVEGEAAGDGATAAPATGAMSFDSGDFPFAHYIGRMRQKIAATWRPPVGSPEEKGCRVYFRVHRNGSVSNVSVEESSGVFLFDQSCQRAVFEAAPLPPLPREYDEEYLGVHFSFVYRETQ
ncbi:MAG TPA: energy transducer TonB [Candidatus Krumholzibacteria bacterium]|nr:energy transducer TonB [Candidatus Krumholzibacteria bacterium]